MSELLFLLILLIILVRFWVFLTNVLTYWVTAHPLQVYVNPSYCSPLSWGDNLPQIMWLIIQIGLTNAHFEYKILMMHLINVVDFVNDNKDMVEIVVSLFVPCL